MLNLGAEGLVGRDEALTRLNVVLAAAAAGTRTLVLVSGESGIGKTELVRTATRGRDVAWGTGIDDASAPAYWPWSRALDHLAHTIGLDRARRLAGEDAGLLATLVPALGERRPGEGSARERWLLLDAVSRWLDQLAAVTPVVIVLDDLQWADESSLVLIDVVARAARPAALCLIACYRPDELTGPARARIAGLATTAEHVELGGLELDAVAAVVAAVAGPVPAPTVAEIYRRAGGHPVFTRELALLGAHDATTRIPLAVREAIERRVGRLAPATRRVLEVAALAGVDVHPDVIAHVLGATVPDVEQACAPAVDAGVLDRGRDGGLRFAHDLYRETLAGSVEPTRRPLLHHGIGQALEDRMARGGDVSPSELARHFAAAVAVEGPTRAARWALAAAERDRQSFAFAEAAGHLRRWRAAVADAGVAVGEHLLIDALVCEADVLSRAGSAIDARGLLRTAHDIAVRSGDVDRLADVALAVADLGAQFSTRRDEVVRELEEALVALGGVGGAVEARLTAALARELQHSVVEDRPRAAVLSERALELGRAAGDAQTLLGCLLAHHDVLWTPGGAGARVDIAREIVAVAQRGGDDERRAQGLLLLANALLEQGSTAYLPVLESCLELLDRLGEPRHRYVVETRRAALALLGGELDEAAARIEAAAAVGERIREPDTENVRMSQRLELVRARGVPDELAAFAARAVGHWTGAPVHAHAVAAGFLARAGDVDGARRHVATVLDLGTWRIDRSYLWNVLVRELSVAAIALHDHGLSEQLLADVAPLAGSCGVNGAVVAFAGSHAHTAGLLAGALGRDGDPLLQQAEGIYRRLGAAGWAAEIERARRAPQEPTGRSMRRQARTWRIAYDGEEAVVPHSKGLSDLATLLARPGQDIHVLDLYGVADRSGPPGDIADRTAIASYRRRLIDLEADAAQAAGHNDLERQARIEQERQALVDELSRVTGLGDRRRSFSSYPAERARKAVTGRLRDAIRKLEQDLPRLAAHLDAGIITGTYCRYRADAGHPWRIEADAEG